jgi:hypothetical protein
MVNPPVTPWPGWANANTGIQTISRQMAATIFFILLILIKEG